MHYYRLIEHKRSLEERLERTPNEATRKQIVFIVKELCRLHETDEGIKTGQCNKTHYKIITLPHYQWGGKRR